MRRAFAVGLLLLLGACEIVRHDPEETEAKEKWWNGYYNRSKDDSDTCGFWGKDCKKNTTTNEYGW